MKKSIKMAVPALFAVLALAFAGCGSSGGGGAANPSRIPTKKDSYEGAGGDNTYATASRISVGQTQQRSLFGSTNDVDWVKVFLNSSTTYEISANDLSVESDIEMYVFDDQTGINGFGNYSTGNEPYFVGTSDDYVSYDSSVRFTTANGGTYYIRVWGCCSADADYIASYTLRVTDLGCDSAGNNCAKDVDDDGFSTTHDCDDNDITVYPGATEVKGDGIDQDCDGIDYNPTLSGQTGAAEDTVQTAGSLSKDDGESFEIIQRRATTRANERAIVPADDTDIIKLSIPARGAYFVDDRLNKVQFDLYTTAGGTPSIANSTGAYIENDTDRAVNWYLEYHSANFADYSGNYSPFAAYLGTDQDNDGYYTGAGWYWDCDDEDANINSGATEVTGNAIDEDCDGVATP